MFRPLVSTVRDKNFQCASVFCQVVLENPIRVPLLVPTNHPQMKCEKTELNNLFVSILDEDEAYGIQS